MNFLGHIFFSNNDQELMYANLFGDTVKGKKYLSFPSEIQKGILLHRKIDDYIDHHPNILKLKKTLYEELPKVSSVAIDLFFDHLLAKHWNDFHHLSYTDFLNQFYEYQPENWNYYPKDFQQFIAVMRERRWLNYYPYEEGLIKSCEGVSSRITFTNKLHLAPIYFHKYEELITEVFRSFMSDASVYLADHV